MRQKKKKNYVNKMTNKYAERSEKYIYTRKILLRRLLGFIITLIANVKRVGHYFRIELCGLSSLPQFVSRGLFNTETVQYNVLFVCIRFGKTRCDETCVVQN